MSRMSLLIIISIIVMSYFLSACSWFGSDVPTAEISIRSAQYLNPDINGRASPVVLTIYQLKKPNKFKQASYLPLENNSASVLGEDLIDKNSIEIRPKEATHLSELLSDDTQYLGIVAGYRNTNMGQWHKVIKIDSKKNILYALLISQ